MDPRSYALLVLIPILPLVGAIWNGLAGHRMPRNVVGALASLMPISAFAIALKAFFDLRALPEHERVLHQTLYTWIGSGSFEVPLAFQFDPLTAVMVLVVSGVGSLIHVYSIGYMEHDRSPARYFAYLNLFTFAMLMLVMADNLVLMFVGWEGVGVCSYLLIGFWYEDMDKAIAGKKAFIVNRIGDFGFLLGLFVLFWTLDRYGEATVTFAGIAQQVEVLAGARFLGMPVPAVVGVLFFIGAAGKSAQLPLYVWLPDAMAGPTPVSALIHAATMVTAGVYMVARMGFMYSLPEAAAASTLVATVGGITALFAATIGLFQHDIKKVLAYSTVSQLGYMFIGVGVGAYSAGVFHLMTHAFFKGLLFLAAGSVIVGMHHEQDIRKMGGLVKHMPITAWTFVLAWLAIIGIPPFSGFFSKDEVLWMALSRGHTFVWVLGLLGAACTAFYMTRLVAVTFFGKLRLTEEELHHLPHHRPQESPYVMTVPLVILAVLAVVGGLVGVPEALGGANHFHHWLAPVVDAAHGAAAHGAHGAHGAHEGPIGEYAAIAITMVLVLGSAALAWFLYTTKLSEMAARSAAYLAGRGEGGLAGAVYRAINAKYYVDEAYDVTVVRPLRYGSRDYLWPFDKWVIDGAVNGVAEVVKSVAAILGWVQNGNVKRYLVGMAIGLVLLVFMLTVAVPALASLGGR